MALYRAAEEATANVFLFLDADAVLNEADSLCRLVSRLLSCGHNAVLTGISSYTDKGSGQSLTSLVPFAILSALPLALVSRTKSASLSALNGQCWLVLAYDYNRLAPHLHHKSNVLEDVQIGHYLKCGHETAHAERAARSEPVCTRRSARRGEACVGTPT